MEGPARGSPFLLRLTRDAESSRLQLEFVRRAFELLVSNTQHPVAKPLKQVFSWVAQERCSVRETCRGLKKQGILTRSGRRVWDPATVAGLLRNPAYCGQAAYGKTRRGERRPRLRPQRGRPEVPRRCTVSYARPAEEWIRVVVPALISTELFETAAEQLRDNRQRHRIRQRGAGHLLQGLLVCQRCGYACYGQSTRRPISVATVTIVASGRIAAAPTVSVSAMFPRRRWRLWTRPCGMTCAPCSRIPSASRLSTRGA